MPQVNPTFHCTSVKSSWTYVDSPNVTVKIDVSHGLGAELTVYYSQAMCTSVVLYTKKIHPQGGVDPLTDSGRDLLEKEAVESLVEVRRRMMQLHNGEVATLG